MNQPLFSYEFIYILISWLLL